MTFIRKVPDSRMSKRYRVLKEGKIVSQNLATAVNVSVRDLSASGAQVSKPANVGFPQDFGLLVVSEQLLYPAVLRWQLGETAGIEFVGEPRHTVVRNQI